MRATSARSSRPSKPLSVVPGARAATLGLRVLGELTAVLTPGSSHEEAARMGPLSTRPRVGATPGHDPRYAARVKPERARGSSARRGGTLPATDPDPVRPPQECRMTARPLTVRSEFQLRLVVPGAASLPVRAGLSYDAHAP